MTGGSQLAESSPRPGDAGADALPLDPPYNPPGPSGGDIGLAENHRTESRVEMRRFPKPERFWSELTQVEGSATPYVIVRTLVFGAIALVITVVEELSDPTISVPL